MEEAEGLVSGSAGAEATSASGVDRIAVALALSGASRGEADAFLREQWALAEKQSSLIDIKKHHMHERFKHLHLSVRGKQLTARSILVRQFIVGAAVFALFNSSVSAEEALLSDAGNSLLSRITVQVPLYTRHVPQDAGFNDHNWGALVDVALCPNWSIVLGDITNSYYRNTAAAAARYSIYTWDFPSIKIDTGVMLGFDLSGGYKDRNYVDPLLGALSIKITGNHFSKYEMLNRTGVAFTVIPGETFALNVSLTFGL